MVIAFYGVLLVLSFIFAAAYIFMWHKHFDVNLNMVFTLVPVACLGYVLSERAQDLNDALVAQQVIYIGGCFLQLFILLCILGLCRIEVSNRQRAILFMLSACMYASVLTIGQTEVFYAEASFAPGTGLVREYGPMHTLFYVVIILEFLAGMLAIIFSLMHKEQVPRRIITLLIIPDIICFLSYFVGRKLIHSVDIVPLGYVLAEVVFLLIVYRLNLYDVSDTVIDSMIKEQSIGYISFDFDRRYLGSNEVAKEIVPELKGVLPDEKLGETESQKKIRHFLDEFEESSANNSFRYILYDPEGDEDKDRFFAVEVSFLYDGSRKRGYIVSFTDDTAKQKYISLLDGYNENLQAEVKEKTKHIEEMHDNLIMSLAMMVESRDNSTGGHIKRTSEGVRLLIEEILKEGSCSLSQEFCHDVIKAAPMHDLGKIAVDDAILRKPGRFTDEEFEKMKMHAAEGARVIHEILLNTDDEAFKQIAENVAHYHHERWDGSGYPEGLAGEDIPFEARIMAIADVYDALVSKRVYKEAMSFEAADAIIMKGMRSQFDPGLEKAYINARPGLEEYYSKTTAAV